MNIKLLLLALIFTLSLNGSNTPYEVKDGLDSQWRIESLSIALLKAVWQGDYQWIDFLIMQGADPLYEDDKGNNALTVLMGQQVDLPAHKKFIETVLQLGALIKDSSLKADRCQILRKILLRKISDKIINYSPKALQS